MTDRTFILTVGDDGTVLRIVDDATPPTPESHPSGFAIGDRVRSLPHATPYERRTGTVYAFDSDDTVRVTLDDPSEGPVGFTASELAHAEPEPRSRFKAGDRVRVVDGYARPVGWTGVIDKVLEPDSRYAVEVKIDAEHIDGDFCPFYDHELELVEEPTRPFKIGDLVRVGPGATYATVLGPQRSAAPAGFVSRIKRIYDDGDVAFVDGTGYVVSPQHLTLVEERATEPTPTPDPDLFVDALPTEPGLYVDREGGVWQHLSGRWGLVLAHSSDEGGRCPWRDPADSTAHRYLPFRRIRPAEVTS